MRRWLWVVVALSSGSSAAAGEAESAEPTPGSCLVDGQWLAPDAWVADPDGCNRTWCKDGQAVSTIRSCESISILETVVFHRGQAKLPRRADATLAIVAEILVNHQYLVEVHVEGHAEPGEPDGVAQARAVVVRDALIHQGVSPDRLVAIAAPTTAAGRSVRFEIATRRR